MGQAEALEPFRDRRMPRNIALVKGERLEAEGPAGVRAETGRVD